MDDGQKKIAVVIVGIALTAGIVVWRSARALREVHEAQAANGEAGETIVTNIEAHAPEGFRSPNISGLMEEPRLPHFELGTIKVRAGEAHIRQTFQPMGFHMSEVPPARAMGANAVWHKQIDTDLPDLELGRAETTDVFYLVYVTDVPDAWRSRLNGMGCWVSSVTPGSAAEEAGLEADDIMLDVDHLRAGGADFKGCAIVDALRERSTGQPVVLTVLRGGKTVDLTLQTRPHALYGYYADLPVFPAGTTQLPR